MSAIEAAFFGSLGRDAELKTSAKSGKPYLRLNVRVGDGDGAQWVSVMSFDSDAIEMADRLTKGAAVYIEGSLRLDEWIGQDGAKRHGLSVMSWHTRLAAIGRNKPRRNDQVSVAAVRRSSCLEQSASASFRTLQAARKSTGDFSPVGTAGKSRRNRSDDQAAAGNNFFDDAIPF